jgi:hypothetical protein
MKFTILFFLLTFPYTPLFSQKDNIMRNNNFYDDTETISLKGGEIEIAGEVENPGFVDLNFLTKHSVIVKEALLEGDGKDTFVGAYRYDGYSLFDILTNRIISKKNKKEFSSIIDLYVEIENDKRETVVVSWGEIFYPNNLSKIILATDVSRIVPSKTKDLWPLPQERKLIIGSDLITERNISNPVKITVRSYARSIPVNRDIYPLYSGEIKLLSNNDPVITLSEIPPGIQSETAHTIFYGRGRGIHSTQPFTGIYLKELLVKYWPVNAGDLKTGLFAIIGIDGYRSVFSYSEIMNRNDQSEVLLVPCKQDEKEGGKFRLFSSADFFSDRAVKAISEIQLFNSESVK